MNTANDSVQNDSIHFLTVLCTLTIGFIARTNLEARSPAPTEDHNPSAAFTFTHDVPLPSEPMTLWYRQPAAEWTESLPIGNGRLGAMVYGGIQLVPKQAYSGVVDERWRKGYFCAAGCCQPRMA